MLLLLLWPLLGLRMWLPFEAAQTHYHLNDGSLCYKRVPSCCNGSCYTPYWCFQGQCNLQLQITLVWAVDLRITVVLAIIMLVIVSKLTVAVRITSIPTIIPMIIKAAVVVVMLVTIPMVNLGRWTAMKEGENVTNDQAFHVPMQPPVVIRWCSYLPVSSHYCLKNINLLNFQHTNSIWTPWLHQCNMRILSSRRVVGVAFGGIGILFLQGEEKVKNIKIYKHLTGKDKAVGSLMKHITLWFL